MTAPDATRPARGAANMRGGQGLRSVRIAASLAMDPDDYGMPELGQVAWPVGCALEDR
jgi:hypothetical protein